MGPGQLGVMEGKGGVKAGFWREDYSWSNFSLNCGTSNSGKKEGYEAKVSAPSFLLPSKACPGQVPTCPGLHQGLGDQEALWSSAHPSAFTHP